MNFLHGHYRKAGKISDDDMLYTLSLFALGPSRWTARFEWRSPTKAGRCALGVFWRDLGDAMEIPYDRLKSHIGSDREDGLTWLEALEAWSVEYEMNHMVPVESNEAVSRATLDVALFNVPALLRRFALKCLSGPSVTKSNAVFLRRYYPIPDCLLTIVSTVSRNLGRFTRSCSGPPYSFASG
jgi:hypothetical protein